MIATQATIAQTRLSFVDNLRAMAIALVVTMHAAVTYSNLGSWYFKEPPPRGTLNLIVFGMYQSFLQAWFMGFLFFLAGYFVPASFDRKGPRKFLADRAFRLGVPSLLYALLIHPFLVWFMLRIFYRGTAAGYGSNWLHYLTSFQFLGGTGPMWFAVALLIFCIVYAGIRLLTGTRKPAPAVPLPSDAAVILLILAISICTFLARTQFPLGGAVLNMQFGFFSQYILLFIAGILAWRGNWLRRIPYRFGIRWMIISSVVGVILWLAVLIGGGALSGADFAVFNGGWHWQSAGMAFWESFYCVGTCLGLIVLFRDKFNFQNRATRFLTDNAFSVYVFHPPILIAVTFALHRWAAPALLRFAVASVLAIAISFLASHFIFRRIPVLKEAIR